MTKRKYQAKPRQGNSLSADWLVVGLSAERAVSLGNDARESMPDIEMDQLLARMEKHLKVALEFTQGMRKTLYGTGRVDIRAKPMRISHIGVPGTGKTTGVLAGEDIK